MLNIKNLKTTFKVGDKQVTAVDDVSFTIPERQTIGLVGESGSGKSITALSILNLIPNNGTISQGEVLWKGKDLLKLPKKERKHYLGKEIGLIFQNPLAALNPVFTIGNQFVETIQLHEPMSKEKALQKSIELLTQVNIPDAETRLNDYPHQFSIGMCQRLMIALTLAMNPSILIADEPTASLDVTIQAQILHLLDTIKKERDMSILLISHDLGVIAQHCDYILIMYLGRIVEKGTPEQIFGDPKHPYTQALISSIPIPDPSQKNTPTLLQGDIPSPMNLPSGCRFHTRCPKVFDECPKKDPKLKPLGPSQEVACLLYN